MPGHNAFQRNAFQRNAFQIVYEFAPIVDGGLVLGGNVTASFNAHRTAVVSGGLVLGGNVTARFHSGAIPPPPVRRHGTAGRVWRNIFPRPRHYMAKVSGGLVIGGSLLGSWITFPAEEIELISFQYLGRVSGGLVLGGSVEAQFISLPMVYISEAGPISQPDPEPVSYKAVSALGGGVGLGGGVRARFHPAPPPPESPSPGIFTFFNRHKAQLIEEDDLIVMDVL